MNTFKEILFILSYVYLKIAAKTAVDSASEPNGSRRVKIQSLKFRQAIQYGLTTATSKCYCFNQQQSVLRIHPNDEPGA